MLFSSVTFLFYFFPAFLILYFLTRFRNSFLLSASLLFYAWGEAEYVLLLIASCLANYVLGLLIGRANGNGRRYLLFTGIAANLGLLGFYKYLPFFLQSANRVATLFHFPLLEEVTRHLPLGISFFTFQAISYLVDIFRNEIPAEKNLIHFGLYVTLFPKLQAGPIARFGPLMDQVKAQKMTVALFSEGIQYFIAGLGQKILIANTIAKAVDAIYRIPTRDLDMGLSWLAAMGYTLQIYFDFSGYTHMAIGLGLMLGFRLPENFNYPYISESVTEFWRRWHISLSSWFRDYLYIPLGGNQKGLARTYIHLFAVFFLCGLWHGAGWTFAAWGIFHGLFMVLERMGFKAVLERMPRVFRHLYCLSAVTVGWVLFRAESFDRAALHLKAMVGLGTGDGRMYPLLRYLQNDVILALCAGALLSVPLIEKAAVLSNTFCSSPRSRDFFRSLVVRPLYLSALGLILFGSVMGIASGAYNPFIYFRF